MTKAGLQMQTMVRVYLSLGASYAQWTVVARLSAPLTESIPTSRQSGSGSVI